MTGFLRRLASGTLHADRAIHPDVGSVWSAPRNPDHIESPSETLVSPRPDDERSRSPILPARDLLVQEAVPLRRADQSPRSQPIVEPAAFTPLIPPSQSNAVSDPRPSDPAHHNEAFPPTQQDAPPVPAAAPHPLHAESSSRPPLPSTRIAAPHPVAYREPGPSMRQPQFAPPQAAEPDIEIHIGRIEVVAVPPPSRQPAPRPARKSLDLGEYLSGDRRTR